MSTSSLTSPVPSAASAAMQNWLAMVSPAKRAARFDSTGATTGTGTNAGTSAGSSAGALASQDVFLQLLVTQLKNQDPENPTDGTQFVTELAQFTTLDQTTQGTSDLGSILQLLQAAGAAANTSKAPAQNATPAGAQNPGSQTS